MSTESRLGRPPLLLTRIAMFVAVGLVAGLALSAIPNVELVTAVCFVAGFLLGAGRRGCSCGGLTEALFAGFHPMGSSFGLLLVAQVLGMALAGLAGAMAAWLVGGQTARRVVSCRRSLGLGMLATIVFDILTNLAFPCDGRVFCF